MTRSLITIAIFSLTIAATSWTQSAPVLAAEDIEQMVANAKTAADHEAIAAYYTREAEAAKEKAALHSRMLTTVKQQGGPGVAKWHMDDHCAALVKEFEAVAKKATELATAQRDIAKGLK